MVMQGDARDMLFFIAGNYYSNCTDLLLGLGNRNSV